MKQTMKHFLILIMMAFSLATVAQTQLSPNMQVTDINGSRQELFDIIKGDLPVIVTFWATWCKPCHEELSALTELKDEWSGKIRIVAISVDDARAAAKVRSLASGRKWPFEVYQDINQELKRSLGISDIPYSIIVDGQGNILYRHTGYTPGSESILIDKAIRAAGK